MLYRLPSVGVCFHHAMRIAPQPAGYVCCLDKLPPPLNALACQATVVWDQKVPLPKLAPYYCCSLNHNAPNVNMPKPQHVRTWLVDVEDVAAFSDSQDGV